MKFFKYIKLKKFKYFSYLSFLLSISTLVFFQSSVSPNDEVIHDIKSMSWKKIKRKISQKPKITQTEAYALVRYHEESPNPNKEYRVRLLYSILTGNLPSSVQKEEVLELLKNTFSFDKPIIRISYWKLYSELINRNLLNTNEKIQYLEKYPLEADPIFINAFEEICKLLLETGNFNKILIKISDLKDEDKLNILTDKIRFYQALSLEKTGESQKAQKLLLQIMMEDSSIDLKKEVFSELKKISGNEFFIDLNISELSYFLTVLNKDEQKNVLQKGIIPPDITVNDLTVIKNIVNFYLKIIPKVALNILYINQSIISNEHIYLANISESLINNKEYTLAYSLQNEFLLKSETPLVFKNYSRIYESWNDEERKFNSRVKYLSLYPYDLTYQDLLIDYLAETNSNSVTYAPARFWEKAMNEIPNVSVKGRLVYWYLRYLRFSGDKEKLRIILSDFYNYCPGSYYAGVISEEFKNELSELSHPSNYLSNRDSLLKFISVKHNIDFIGMLGGQNLSFAFSKNAIDLANRLAQASEKVNSSKILMTVVEYLRLGSHKEAMMLADHYFKINKINEKEKNEILVGIGDLSKNNYLSLYHTRVLMKNLHIPDDPLLIPKDLILRLYPRPHRSLVKKNSERFGIEEEVVYAIMRQESFFRENAISPANARGLMQVMPSTGKFLASKLNVQNYSLHDPEVSIQFGAKFLSDLLKQNDNKLTWASIAYNGGPGNLRKWKRNHYKGDFNHFLEELPNKESRDYCRVIISNYNIYKNIRKMEK